MCNTQNKLVCGQIVRVTAGRDAPNAMVIVGFSGSDYVLLANGKNRALAAPKKKKIKHIARTNSIVPSAELSDASIRIALAKYNAKNKEGEDCEQK